MAPPHDHELGARRARPPAAARREAHLLRRRRRGAVADRDGHDHGRRHDHPVDRATCRRSTPAPLLDVLWRNLVVAAYLGAIGVCIGALLRNQVAAIVGVLLVLHRSSSRRCSASSPTSAASRRCRARRPALIGLGDEARHRPARARGGGARDARLADRAVRHRRCAAARARPDVGVGVQHRRTPDHRSRAGRRRRRRGPRRRGRRRGDAEALLGLRELLRPALSRRGLRGRALVLALDRQADRVGRDEQHRRLLLIGPQRPLGVADRARLAVVSRRTCQSSSPVATSPVRTRTEHTAC